TCLTCRFVFQIPAEQLAVKRGKQDSLISHFWSSLGEKKKFGDSVQLSCHGSGFTFKDFDICWYRQAPGSSLEWVSYISSPLGSTEKYSAAVEGRATVFRNNSQAKVYLTLHNLQFQDSAQYFCAREPSHSLQ
uniref:Ig-like domain-containing protein n=1 Tax=Apteryx owenii TaxID=8824 RepID=A0A8B9S411_APTOW